uniref:Sucrose operon repressor ScrR n=1 Tax=uncultured bacterium Contig12 TaxID=1393397 RepID=W0FMR7_9BACT|nr:sucrose operon repressor ScrR [uncultured bacterium Contig12]
MAKTTGNPTMVDVARKAGVALGTVSKVVNGQPVGEEYREKVLAAISVLGYHVNNTGRSLRTDRTHTVALIIPNIINPYFSLLVHHINVELEKRDYVMQLCFSEYSTNRENEFILAAQSNRVDGIIALTYNPNLVIPENVSFVTIDRYFSSSVPCIASDNFGGGALAARKLVELGCRKLAFIRTCSVLTNEPSKRREGFISACVEMGISYEIMAVEEGEPFSTFENYLDSHLHEEKLDFDGLFLGTDMLAWQVVQALRRRRIRVPEDVQVIGFDGIRMFGNLEPVVSTIVQPVSEIAESSVSTVLSHLPHGVPPLITLPVSYLYGGTTLK